jgi:hypothetical protein
MFFESQLSRMRSDRIKVSGTYLSKTVSGMRSNRISVPELIKHIWDEVCYRRIQNFSKMRSDPIGVPELKRDDGLLG